MTPQPDALPACPSCGHISIGIETYVTDGFYAFCRSCHACGPYVSKEKAIAAFTNPAHALAASRAEVERERASKDGAYDERNRLVAVLAALYPSSLERHPDEDTTWESDWRWIVFVDLPTGQATWHIHDSHLPLFDHVPSFAGRKWDGHNTEAKYKRIEAMAALAAQGGGT